MAEEKKNITTEPLQDLQYKFDNLSLQLRKLIARYEELKLLYRQAQEERSQLKLTIEKQKETIKNFQNRPKLDTIVGPIVGESSDIKAISLKIEEYIQQIDQCINNLTEQ